MSAIELIPSYYYSAAWHIFFLVICWFTILYHVGSNTQKILHADSSPLQGAALLLTILVIVFLGLRPVSDSFVDMRLYAYAFLHNRLTYIPVDLHREWLWTNIIIFCKRAHMTVNEYFLFIEILNVGCMFIMSWKLMRKNLWLMMLFFLTAFQFYNFATNGIRNGLACSVELVAIAFLVDADKSKASKYISFFLMFLALGCHRSTMLPTVSALASYYYFKDPKFVFRFWLASIAISLVAGPLVEQFFVSLGFDDRMEQYSSARMGDSLARKFSSTGFRWDFLLYSAAPVLMIWYVTRYRRFTDKTFLTLGNTYLFCNAFWIMVIRSSFSNRFAYLSWFLYPIVIAYPLLRMNLWKDQDRKTAIIFFLYSGFTFFMYFIYYFGTSGFKGFGLFWWKK